MVELKSLSQWMIFDLTNQEWSVFPNKHKHCNYCNGHLVTVRGGFHYYFHTLDYSNEDEIPIYRIYENGTSVKLDIGERPEGIDGFIDGSNSFNLAPFYQRFYMDSQFTLW